MKYFYLFLKKRSKCLNEFHTRILEEYVKYMTDSLKAITL